jgi:hypothetical protein
MGRHPIRISWDRRLGINAVASGEVCQTMA